MAKQAGVRQKGDGIGSPAAPSIHDLIKRCTVMPPAAKRLVRDGLRRLEADLKTARAGRASALTAADEAMKRHTSAVAELDLLREIHAGTRASLDEARASQIALQAANADLARALDAARTAPPPVEPPTPLTISSSAPSSSSTPAAAAFAPAELRRPAASARTPRPEASAPPLRPTPATPEADQAPTHRGRVDTRTAVGALLVRAPSTPGGYAGACFATLLDRAAADLPTLALEDDDAPAYRHGARDDLGALADLYRLETAFYRDLIVHRGDGLPLNGDLMRAAMATTGGSSPAQACMEEAGG